MNVMEKFCIHECDVLFAITEFSAGTIKFWCLFIFEKLMPGLIAQIAGNELAGWRATRPADKASRGKG